MKNVIIKLLLGIAGLMSALFALPVISSYTGKVSGDSVITITGSGFGATGPSIILYDDFNGVAGQNIPLTDPKIGQWTSNGPLNGQPIYHAEALSGSTGFAINIKGTSSERQFQKVFPTPITEVFISYWVRIPDGTTFPGASAPLTWNPASCWKMTWLYAGDAGYSGDNDFCLPTWVSPGSPCIGGNDGPFYYLSNSWWSWTSWIRISIWLRANPANLTDSTGTSLFQTISQEKGLATELKTGFQVFDTDSRSGGPTTKEWDRINFPGWFGNGNFTGCDAAYDDVYIAGGSGSFARVELGDAATYTACKKLSLATPAAWDEHNITATIRAGNFAAGNQAYLYVSDSAGNTNAVGYPVTFGQSTNIVKLSSVIPGKAVAGHRFVDVSGRSIQLSKTRMQKAGKYFRATNQNGKQTEKKLMVIMQNDDLTP